MKKYFDVLRKCPLFNQIEDENLLSLLTCLKATIRSYPKKNTIIAEGEKAVQMGILLSGSAQIIQIDYFGNRSIVSDIAPSQLFAEAFACAGVAQMPVSVIANEPCEIMFISFNRAINTCCNACEFHSKIIYNLMNIMARKNIAFHEKIQITSNRTTREKLLSYLTIQAKKAGSNSFEIPFDRQELADYLQTDRSGLSAQISKLRDEGIIESRKNRFKLL